MTYPHEQGLRTIVQMILVYLGVLIFPGPLGGLDCFSRKHCFIYPNKLEAVGLGLV